ncbi:MAG: MinD/ParA family protein [Synergistales bacterium]|nr:MinD/ParA family protein [Synergistales bacterium]
MKAPERGKLEEAPIVVRGRQDAASRGEQSDQAAHLRKLASAGAPENGGRRLQSIAVLSGKGGVGKTHLCVNLGIALSRLGRRVLIFDADLGMANVDLLFGMMPTKTLKSVISGSADVRSTLVSLGENLKVLPGGAGMQDLADMDQNRQYELIGELATLEDEADTIVIDTSAGIHNSILSFALASDMTLLLTTPEPTSVRDAYGVLKSLVQRSGGRVDIRLVVNMAMSNEEARGVAERMQGASRQFLGVPVPYLGYIPWDRKVREAVQLRRPLVELYESTAVGRSFYAIAEQIAGQGAGEEEALLADRQEAKGIRSFLFKLTKRLGLGA